MNTSNPELVYLHTGCEWSEPWDAAFTANLEARGIRHKVCDLATVSVTEPGVFLGRFSEKGRHYRNNYAARTKQFEACWPEPSAFALYDDKCKQADWLQVHGYPQPAYENVTGSDFKWNTWPAMFKRPDGSASKNVKLVSGPEEVEVPGIIQEFCSGNSFDYRVTVIGDQVSTIGRKNRDNDVRASGSGKLFVCDTRKELAQLCWGICQKAGWASMGFDVLKHKGEWVIIEMSYTWPIYGITKWTSTERVMPDNYQRPRTEHPVTTLLNYLYSDSTI